MSAGHPRRGRASGFTLVEVLAALVIFGFVVAGLAAGVRMGLLAWRVQTETVARDADLDTVDRALTRLLVALSPSGPGDATSVSGSAHTVAFETTLPVRIGTVPTDRADVRLELKAGELELAVTPHYHAELLGPPPAASVLPLASGVAELTIGYWQHSTGTWVSGWSDVLPPELVRVQITFRDGRRRWPPIVARPALSRYAS